MAMTRLSQERMQQAVDSVVAKGSIVQAAKFLKLPYETLRSRYYTAKAKKGQQC